LELVDAIKLLVFLMPGFIVLKIISLKCDVKLEDYKYYVVEALIYSVFIYMVAGFTHLNANLDSPINILCIFLLATLSGIIIAEVKNLEIISKLFNGTEKSLSSHDKIYYIKAHAQFKEKWHVIGLKNGKELCGIVRAFNTENNEMLIEKARWISKNGNMAPEFGWVYFPPNQELEYMRTLEPGD
jgi:uncharacterized protein involved in tellurium resistance